MEERTSRLSLIVQYYRCTTNERQAEIDTCLRNNLVNPYLSAIHLLTEELFDVSSFPNNEKIVQTVIGERLTFERAFTYANEVDPTGQMVWVLCNADIYFDESLHLVEQKYLDGTVYALTRHDVQPDGTTKLVDEDFAHGCQDAWLFKSSLSLSSMFTQFYLGIPGCDNRIANEFIQAGYKLINPAYLLRALHLDLTRKTDIRERDKEYASLMTNESIANGQVAPPPYQYHIYPVDQFDPDSPKMYQAYIRHFSELGQQISELDSTVTRQFRQEKVLNSQIAEMARQIVELGELLAERDNRITSLIESTSWKVTAPLRKLLDIIKRINMLLPL